MTRQCGGFPARGAAAVLALALGADLGRPASAGQPPYAAATPDVPMSGRDRVYAAEQFSNTVSVVDPSSNRLLGVIRLGDPAPTNFSPLYRGQVLVHGMGFSPDGRTLAVVSIGSNSVTFVDTATSSVRQTTYVGRSPHEAFFTPDGREVWVTVRGESHVVVIDAVTFQEVARISTPDGPGMTIFSPDGRYAYVCSSFTPRTVVIEVASRRRVGEVVQASPFCPNIAATPDGLAVWLTLKDVGKVMVFDARPPFAVRAVIDTGPITDHVNFARTARGTFAYVTVGGLNRVKVFRTEDLALVGSIAVGDLPHGIWPSGDGSRMYVGLENGDALVVVDTSTFEVVATVPIGQAPQAVNYVPGAVPDGEGAHGLRPLGTAGIADHVRLVDPSAARTDVAATSVALFDQGLVQVLQASVTGLTPGGSYVLAFSEHQDGTGTLEPLAAFIANAAGAAIVDAIGPIRQLVRARGAAPRRYLVIAPQGAEGPQRPVQLQAP